MNKDQNLINEFAIKTLKENLNVMYAQIWREGQLTAEYKRMPVKTRLNTWSAFDLMRRLWIFFQSMHRRIRKDIWGM